MIESEYFRDIGCIDVHLSRGKGDEERVRMYWDRHTFCSIRNRVDCRVRKRGFIVEQQIFGLGILGDKDGYGVDVSGEEPEGQRVIITIRGRDRVVQAKPIVSADAGYAMGMSDYALTG